MPRDQYDTEEVEYQQAIADELEIIDYYQEKCSLVPKAARW